MSRLAKKIISIPNSITAEIAQGEVVVKGPLGENRVLIPWAVEVTKTDGGFRVRAKGELKKRDRALVGTLFRLIQNAVWGVIEGFTKKLEVNGVGFKVAVSGQTLTMSLGYSHPVTYSIPQGMKVAVDKNVITLSGSNKQSVGQVAAEIRKLRVPEPYKGTGIKYLEEVIRRKAGKQVKAAGAA